MGGGDYWQDGSNEYWQHHLGRAFLLAVAVAVVLMLSFRLLTDGSSTEEAVRQNPDICDWAWNHENPNDPWMFEANPLEIGC
jgi:hypothetical protein